VIAKKLA
jgi:hypothetical protein